MMQLKRGKSSRDVVIKNLQQKMPSHSLKTFDSIHHEKIIQILLTYKIPPETVNTLMMLHKDSTTMVRSPDEDTNLFEVMTGVL